MTGIAEAARALGTPVIGGNVSLYNESDGQAVWPTPVIGMVGLIDDAEKVVTSGFKRPGDVVFVLGAPGAGPRALGGSRYLASLHGVVKGPLPELDLDLERRVQEACLEAAAAGILASAHGPVGRRARGGAGRGGPRREAGRLGAPGGGGAR